MNIYFTDFFAVDPDVLEDYGAFNLSLINDLPLFVDPFLLFNSENPTYRQLHEDIIRYMRFLKDVSVDGTINPGLIPAWFTFPEVKQTWLGFSLTGNSGRGLGRDFAAALYRNLRSVFRDFGAETVTRSSHIEKLCLIGRGVGRDNISDFATNLIKHFLADYTQGFALEHVAPNLRRRFTIAKAVFNYETRSWASRQYELPAFDGDHVLLTPKDILTKDEAWINRPELLDTLESVADSLPDSVLRAQVNEYLVRVLPRGPKVTRKEVREAASRVVEQFPALLDYYVRDKEDEGERASSVAKTRVAEAEARFYDHVRGLVSELLASTPFYRLSGNTYDEARQRLLFFKDVVENKGGHRYFYVNGRPVEREGDLQVLFRLTWYGSTLDVSREVNDGRGPADFKVSRGATDKTLIEFKLAKNSHLERNLAKQAEIYEAASGATNPTLKAILFFTGDQLARVHTILDRLKLRNSPHIVLIDARADNKPSGSKA